MASYRVRIIRERCKGCHLCIHFCKNDVLCAEEEVNAHGYFSAAVKDGADCVGCTFCYLVCPDMAVEIEKEDS